ncbi:MAG: flagellar protein FlaG [Deltaproteobacteria bacterium]|nr:flagellar protein FlaG [Deltaproteobacteria bacterium]
MNIEAVNMGNIQQQASQKPSDDVATQRKAKESDGGVVETTTDTSKIQPEELLSQIKGLTEDGAYSVRFENDDEANQLVVKIVDTETDEVIRQVPAEEVLTLSARLDELRGNIVNTQG